MQPTPSTPAQYLTSLPADRRKPLTALRNIILKNLPKGFAEVMAYGMIGYVVPHKLYPPGYHVDPKLPLGFMSIASQKNFIALYHMGIYADKTLLDWFVAEYAEAGVGRLDMGKSCIRFKDPERIPLPLIGRLAARVSVRDWIAAYEKARKTKKS